MYTTSHHPFLLLGALVLLSLLSLAISLSTGSIPISLADIALTLIGVENAHYTLVTELRLPRTISAYVTGGLLAMAGGLMQVLVRNPLADPYILGVSGGASVAALLAMSFGLGGGLLMTGSAFVGALFAMLLVFMLSRGPGQWTSPRLLLTGVVLAAGWGALISFILTISPDQQLHGMLFWLMGDLSFTSQPYLAGLILIVAVVACMPLTRSLNVVIRDKHLATALGIDLPRLHLALYVLASLLTATAVTQAGSIGFVGLVVPHLIRLLGYTDHRILIPAAVLVGGSLLLLADALARTLLAPQQLPVGIITALLGVPLFLYLLRRESLRG